MRRLNLDQLRAVAEVVDTGSFSAAAARLNLTQPAVSLQVRELESKLGVMLVERLGKRAYATPAGATLLAHAKRIDHEVDDAMEAMRRHREGRTARVRLGTGSAILSYLLPPVLRSLRKEHPEIEIYIETSTTQRIVQRLASNDLDIGLVTLPVADKSLVVTPVREDPMVAVLPPGRGRIAEAIDPATLASYPLIIKGRAQMHALARGWFSAAGIEMRAVMELGSVTAIRNVVSTDIGASILPIEAVIADLPGSPVRVRPLDPPLTRTLALVRRPDRATVPGLDAVHDALFTLQQRRLVLRRERRVEEERPRAAVQ